MPWSTGKGKRHGWPASASCRSSPAATPIEPAGFDFTRHIRLLAADMVARLPELARIDLEQVAIRFCQARKAVRHGIQASLTPLRFAGGTSDHGTPRPDLDHPARLNDAAGHKCSIC